MRSHACSSLTGPASVSWSLLAAFAISKALYWQPPRPGVDSVRTTPRMLMLYFRMGMPTLDALRIIWQMLSISRSRSGLFPSMMLGFSERVIYAELSGSGTASSLMPYDSTRSRSLVSPSTDHLSSNLADGRELQRY